MPARFKRTEKPRHARYNKCLVKVKDPSPFVGEDADPIPCGRFHPCPRHSPKYQCKGNTHWYSGINTGTSPDTHCNCGKFDVEEVRNSRLLTVGKDG